MENASGEGSENNETKAVENDDIKVEDVENGNAAQNDETDKNQDENQEQAQRDETGAQEKDNATDPEKAMSAPSSPREQSPKPENDTQDTPGECEDNPDHNSPESDEKQDGGVADSNNQDVTKPGSDEKQDGDRIPEDDDRQSVLSGRNRSRANDRASAIEPELKSTRSRQASRTSVASDPDNNRMYSPDDHLTDKEFFIKLQEDNLKLSKELEQWRESYDVRLDESETSKILRGAPSLAGMGLSKEEEEIADVVVKDKLKELEAMSLDELVEFVRLESF